MILDFIHEDGSGSKKALFIYHTTKDQTPDKDPFGGQCYRANKASCRVLASKASKAIFTLII